MTDNLKDLTLELEQVGDAEVWALAQMVKRIYYEDMRRLAKSDDEAQLMASAVTKLQTALDRAGYSPR